MTAFLCGRMVKVVLSLVVRLRSPFWWGTDSTLLCSSNRAMTAVLCGRMVTVVLFLVVRLRWSPFWWGRDKTVLCF